MKKNEIILLGVAAGVVWYLFFRKRNLVLEKARGAMTRTLSTGDFEDHGEWIFFTDNVSGKTKYKVFPVGTQVGGTGERILLPDGRYFFYDSGVRS